MEKMTLFNKLESILEPIRNLHPYVTEHPHIHVNLKRTSPISIFIAHFELVPVHWGNYNHAAMLSNKIKNKQENIVFL